MLRFRSSQPERSRAENSGSEAPFGSVPTNLSSGPCSCAAIKRYWRSADPRSTAGAEDEASHERARRRTSSQSSSSPVPPRGRTRSEEHTSELQSQSNLVCRLLLEK